MDIDEIRRANIKTLEAELGGISALAAAANMSYTQCLNYRNGALDSETGKPRGMRKQTAWRFEDAGKKPRGWLDQPHDPPDPNTVSGLLAQLAPILDAAPIELRRAVLDLALKYQRDPADGARIVAAIRALTGLPDDPPA